MGSYVELLKACKEGNPKKVKKLVNTCKNIGDVRDLTDKTLLHYCFQNEACTDLILEIVPELLDVGEKSGYTVLHLASMMKPPTPLQYLLTKGPDINKKTNELRTPLLLAVIYDNYEAIKILCEGHAEVNVTDCLGVSPLHYAAKAKSDKDLDHQIRIIDILLQYNAKIEFPDSFDRTPLIWAVSSNNIVKMRHLISKGANLDARDNSGLSILHYATSNGNIQIIEAILDEYHFDINVFDNNRCTPLMYACTMNQSQVVQVLLEKGANVDAEDAKRRSAVHFASGKGDMDILKILADYNADLWKLSEDCNFPLHEASFKGHSEVVKFFVTFCQNTDQPSNPINKENLNGQTPLHLAAVKDHIDICRILLENGADPNVPLRASSGKSMTALDLANRSSTKELIIRHNGKTADDLINMCPITEENTYSISNESENFDDESNSSLNSSLQVEEENPQKIEEAKELEEIEVTETLQKYLLECSYNDNVEELRSFASKGFNLSDIFDNTGKSLLHYSVKNKRTFELILDLAPDCIQKADYSRLSVLNMAVMSKEQESLKMILEKGGDFNYEDEKGRTSLHLAVIYSNLEALRIIKGTVEDHSLILHTPDKDGNYPLHYAVELYNSKGQDQDCRQFIETLLGINGEIECRDSVARTPLLLAVNINNSEAVMTLLENMANILAIDNHCLCSIHYACAEGSLDIFNLLAAMDNFNPDIKDQNGLTPIFYAVSSCNDKIVQRLIDHKATINVIDIYGRNLCHKASEKGAFKCLELLLSFDLDPWLTSNDGTLPLHEAAYRGYKEVAEILLNTPESNKYVNAKNISGQTALHLAAVRNDCPMCFLLINKGSSVNELLYDGISDSEVTAYDLAKTKYCKETLYEFGGRSAKRILDNTIIDEPCIEENEINRLPELLGDNFQMQSQYSIRSTELDLSTLPSMMNTTMRTKLQHSKKSSMKQESLLNKKASSCNSTNNGNFQNVSATLDDEREEILQSSKSSKAESVEKGESFMLSLLSERTNKKESVDPFVEKSVEKSIEKSSSFILSSGTPKSHSKSSTVKSSKRSQRCVSNNSNHRQGSAISNNIQERVHTSILNYEFIRLNSKVACEIARQQIRKENIDKLINPRTPKVLRRSRLK